MEYRSRNKSRSRTFGSVYWNGVPYGQDVEVVESQTCQDYWHKKARKEPKPFRGTVPPSDVNLYRDTYKPGLASGSGGYFACQDHVICKPHPGSYSPHLPAGSYGRFLVDPADITTLLERTNPGRPYFSVPVFMKELVDVIGMFKWAAKSFAGIVGGGYLNYRFGWLSLAKDVEALDEVLKELEDRVKELNSIVKHGGLRRRTKIRVIRQDHIEPNELLTSTWGLFIRGRVESKSVTRVYGSVRWLPTKDYEEDVRKLGVIREAFKQISDLEAPDASTVYQMMPWSWMLDYFTNFGNVLAAQEDYDYFVPHDICITWKTDVVVTAHPTDIPGGYTATAAWSRGTYMSRMSWGVYNPPPSTRVGLLNANQFAVLLSLFLKFRGG